MPWTGKPDRQHASVKPKGRKLLAGGATARTGQMDGKPPTGVWADVTTITPIGASTIAEMRKLASLPRLKPTVRAPDAGPAP